MPARTSDIQSMNGANDTTYMCRTWLFMWPRRVRRLAPSNKTQIATMGAIWSNSNRAKGGSLMRVQDAARVRNTHVNCNVKLVSGTGTKQIESAYARAIPQRVRGES